MLASVLLPEHVLLALSPKGDDVGALVQLFDRASGRELWERSLPTPLVGSRFAWDDNALYVGTDEYVFSLDLSTGRERWVRGPFEGPLTDLAMTDSGLVATFRQDGVVLLHAARGVVLWAHDPPDAQPLHVVETESGVFLVMRRVEDETKAVRMDVLPLQQPEHVWSEVLQEEDRVVRAGDWVVIERDADSGLLSRRAVRVQRDEPEETEHVSDYAALASGQSLSIEAGRGRLLRLRRLFAYEFGETDVSWQRAWPQSSATLHLSPQRVGVLAWLGQGPRVELIDREGETVAEWELDEVERQCTPVEADGRSLLLRCGSGRSIQVIPAER